MTLKYKTKKGASDGYFRISWELGITDALMWKLKDDSDCPVDFPGNWGFYNMDTQQLDHDHDGTLIQAGFQIDSIQCDWLALFANQRAS